MILNILYIKTLNVILFCLGIQIPNMNNSNYAMMDLAKNSVVIIIMHNLNPAGYHDLDCTLTYLLSRAVYCADMLPTGITKVFNV